MKILRLNKNRRAVETVYISIYISIFLVYHPVTARVNLTLNRNPRTLRERLCNRVRGMR